MLGPLGDRWGRRPAMLLSFALIGVSSAGVALVPGRDWIGVAAPLLVILCRLVQGFALGGEVGASTAFLVEAAPTARRGETLKLSSSIAFGATVCVGLAGIVGSLLGGVLSDRRGRKPVMIVGQATTLLLIVPIFGWMIARPGPLSL